MFIIRNEEEKTNYSSESSVIGPPGPQGDTGPTGSTGYTGYTGYIGKKGHTGYTGYTNYAGYTGYTGYKGYAGYTGYTGYPGSIITKNSMNCLGECISHSNGGTVRIDDKISVTTSTLPYLQQSQMYEAYYSGVIISQANVNISLTFFAKSGVPARDTYLPEGLDEDEFDDEIQRQSYITQQIGNLSAGIVTNNDTVFTYSCIFRLYNVSSNGVMEFSYKAKTISSSKSSGTGSFSINENESNQSIRAIWSPFAGVAGEVDVGFRLASTPGNTAFTVKRICSYIRIIS
jgi:hypothetical protein